MPLYSYVCKDCGEKFDLLVGVTAQKAELKCPECKSVNIARTFAAFSTGKSSKSNSSDSSSCPTGTCPLG
jgi:putative FmdB family regulatory protein